MRVTLALALAGFLVTPSLNAQSDEAFNQLKAMVEEMKKTIETQSARIAELEKAVKTNVPPPVPPTPPPAPATTVIVTNRLEASRSYQTLEKVAAGEHVSSKSPVTYRDAMNDQQEAA